MVTCISRNNYTIYNQYLEDFIYPTKEWKDKINISKYDDNIKVSDINLWKEYDNTIGNRTVKGPLEPGRYAELYLPEINNNLIITWGESIEVCLNHMNSNNVEPLGVVNCLNFGDPENCIRDIRESIEKLNEDCKKNNVPIIGGNVSLYNATMEYQLNLLLF